MTRTGVGPRALGSPFKQTNKQYPDLPPAWKSEAAKSDYNKYSDAHYADQASAFEDRMANKATGAIKVDNTIETSVIGGAVLKGISAGAKPAFNVMKSKPSAWKGAAATIGGMFGDDAVIGGAQYAAEEISNNNKKNKK